MSEMTDLGLLIVSALVLALFYIAAEIRRLSKRPKPKAKQDNRRKRPQPSRRSQKTKSHPPKKPRKSTKPMIVLDGSNVMHWGGEPSLSALRKVIGDLQRKNYRPIPIFDASAGYRLEDRFMTHTELAHALGLKQSDVYVVHKGVVADEVILDFAIEHKARIVTNDRYRDWTAKFPVVKQKDRFVRGDIKSGNLVWQRPLKAAA